MIITQITVTAKRPKFYKFTLITECHDDCKTLNYLWNNREKILGQTNISYKYPTQIVLSSNERSIVHFLRKKLVLWLLKFDINEVKSMQ